MPIELNRIVSEPIRRRSPFLILGIVVFALVVLGGLLLLVGGLGWEGY